MSQQYYWLDNMPFTITVAGFISGGVYLRWMYFSDYIAKSYSTYWELATQVGHPMAPSISSSSSLFSSTAYSIGNSLVNGSKNPLTIKPIASSSLNLDSWEIIGRRKFLIPFHVPNLQMSFQLP